MITTFSLTSEAIFSILYGLKSRLSEYNLSVGLTKTNTMYPDAIAMIYLKDDIHSLYVVVNSRFSNSLREYVIQSFELVDFNAPLPSSLLPKVLYKSVDYTTYIHANDFINCVTKEVIRLTDAIENEVIKW